METSNTRTKVIAYSRTSTDKQNISLQAQKAKLEAYASLYDLEIVSSAQEIGSAKTISNRPVLQDALQQLKDGKAEGILVVKLDRLTRSVKDLGALVEDFFSEGRFSLMSVSENIDTRSSAGRLVLNVLASVSQWERESISERTTTALSHLKSSKKRISRYAPYGFRFTAAGKVVENRDEQAIILAARQLKRDKRLSAHRIAKTLVSQGHRNRNGGVFTSGSVIKMLEAA